MESQRKKVSLPFLSTGLYVFLMVLISWENLHMLGGHFTCSDDLFYYGRFFLEVIGHNYRSLLYINKLNRVI